MKWMPVGLQPHTAVWVWSWASSVQCSTKLTSALCVLRSHPSHFAWVNSYIRARHRRPLFLYSPCPLGHQLVAVWPPGHHWESSHRSVGSLQMRSALWTSGHYYPVSNTPKVYVCGCVGGWWVWVWMCGCVHGMLCLVCVCVCAWYVFGVCVWERGKKEREERDRNQVDTKKIQSCTYNYTQN